MRELELKGESDVITKQLVWDAWLKVKENGGAAGGGGVSIEQFEGRLKDNLCRPENRMSSGSYFPGPAQAVNISKKGGTRRLGIPNVVDRVAQTAATMTLRPSVERVFHEDSYGYRPGRSPLEAGVRRDHEHISFMFCGYTSDLGWPMTTLPDPGCRVTETESVSDS